MILEDSTVKVLYCDIDSTLNNHWVRIQRWAMPQFPGTSINPKAFTEEEIMKDAPLPGAREQIRNFALNGWQINYLTARSFDRAYAITKRWLDANNFIKSYIYTVENTEAKIAFLRQNKCNLFIDDMSKGQHYGPSYKELYTDVIHEIVKLGIPLVLFKGNWDDLNLI